jgi:hypothetical protein
VFCLTLATLVACKKKRFLVQAAALFRGRVNGKGVIVRKVVCDILKSTLFLGTTAWAFMAGFCLWR